MFKTIHMEICKKLCGVGDAYTLLIGLDKHAPPLSLSSQRELLYMFDGALLAGLHAPECLSV
jgi:hypothetical protein